MDASSKYFNIKANSRSKKNHIHSLRAADGSLLAQQSQIVELVQEHFEGIMGCAAKTTAKINRERLGLTRHNLQDLEAPFSIAEIKEAIWDLPMDKAPGPDSFSCCFYRSCWEIIRDDINIL